MFLRPTAWGQSTLKLSPNFSNDPHPWGAARVGLIIYEGEGVQMVGSYLDPGTVQLDPQDPGNLWENNELTVRRRFVEKYRYRKNIDLST